MSPRGRTCLVSRLPELRRGGGARAGAPAPPAPARPRPRGSRCGPGRGRRGGSGRGASSTGGTGGGSAMPSSHRPDRSAASADTRPALCRAPLTTSPLADRPGGPPRPRLVGDGADAPSAPESQVQMLASRAGRGRPREPGPDVGVAGRARPPVPTCFDPAAGPLETQDGRPYDIAVNPPAHLRHSQLGVVLDTSFGDGRASGSPFNSPWKKAVR